jgi:hypothetical protein
VRDFFLDQSNPFVAPLFLTGVNGAALFSADARSAVANYGSAAAHQEIPASFMTF